MGGAVGPQAGTGRVKVEVGAMPALPPHPPSSCLYPPPHPDWEAGRLHKVTSFINLIQHKGVLG